PAVLGRIGRANDGAIVQDDSPRPLDLQEERVDRIVDIENRRGGAEPGALDVLARRIRDQPPIRNLPDDALALQRFTKESQVDLPEIEGHAIGRRLIGAMACPAASELGLVVAREEPGARGLPDAIRDELRLEKAAHRLWTIRRDERGGAADVPPLARCARVV